MNLEFERGKSLQGCREIISCFEQLTKDIILHLYVTEKTKMFKQRGFNFIGYFFYVFDIPYEKAFSPPQSLEVFKKFQDENPDGFTSKY